MVRDSLHNYIYNEVVPRYAAFDKAHREDHALMVIDRALSMGKQYDVNEEMLLTAAACHDLGLAVDRKTHHLESGRIIREDKRLSGVAGRGTFTKAYTMLWSGGTSGTPHGWTVVNYQE